MAVTDWIDLTTQVEGYYPLAVGSVENATTGDETLRRNLVPYANKLLLEVMQMRRWGYSYTKQQFALVLGTSSITPMGETGAFSTVRRMFILDPNGFPTELDAWPSKTLDPLFGSAGTAPKGRPKYFFIVGDGTVRIYPAADQAYTLWVEGEAKLDPIVETVGTVSGAPTNVVTVPHHLFLLDPPNSLPSSSSTGGCSLAGAWYQQYVSGKADLISPGWSNILVLSVLVTNFAITDVVTSPFFLRSQNWFFTNFPKMALFGVCREVASYFKSNEDYKLWESRFQHETELAFDHDNDRLKALEALGVGLSGQDQNPLRPVDSMGNATRGSFF